MAWQATVITPWKLISNCSISSVSAATQSKIKHMLLRVTAWRNSCEWTAQQGAPRSYYCAEICWMNYFIFIQIEFCKIFTIFFYCKSVLMLNWESEKDTVLQKWFLNGCYTPWNSRVCSYILPEAVSIVQ